MLRREPADARCETEGSASLRVQQIATLAVERTERFIADLIEQAGFPSGLREAVEYAALEGGKRTRPVLVYLCADACGSVRDDTAGLAASIELVHAFSLVHDDLPCLDDDLLRRGRPTTHAKFGEAMGLLAGDALLNLAYAALLKGDMSAAARVRALDLLSGSTNAMIGGQVLDTLGATGRVPDAELLEEIHLGKTAALIEASCRLGGVSAGAEAGDAIDGALEQYGRAVGLMFQVVDDLIDATGDTQHAGKQTGKDAEAGKLTYPVVHGVEASRRFVSELLDRAQDAAASLNTMRATDGEAPGTGGTLGRYAEELALRTR